ncbi:MAG TPA: hypothetical protein VIW24_25950 [Aldersonia sp.]
MSEFTESPPISWEAMVAWLVDSLRDKPTAFVLDMGPNSYVDEGDDDEVVCAQVLAGDELLRPPGYPAGPEPEEPDAESGEYRDSDWSRSEAWPTRLCYLYVDGASGLRCGG